MNILFTINLASSLFLTGLIWTIQRVHYPIFHRLGEQDFTNHIEFHKWAISLIVVPVMIIEIVTSAWLAWSAPFYQHLHQIGFVLVALIWIITFFIQVPIHNRLSQTHNADVINRLVKTNWLRTTLWSLKSLLSLILLNTQL